MSTTVQSVIVPRKSGTNPGGYTKPAAKAAIKNRGYKGGAPDITTNYFRFRQKNPQAFHRKSFRTITIGNGIKAIIGRTNAKTSRSTKRTKKTK